MEAGQNTLNEILGGLAGSLGSILPELVLTAGFLLAVVLEIAFGRRNRNVVPAISTLSLLLYCLAVVCFWPHAGSREHSLGFEGMITSDAYSHWFRLLIGIAALPCIAIAMQSNSLRAHSKGMGEYPIILLAMVLGMAFMTMARNLLMMYLAMELVSLPAYILTAYARMKNKGSEAALKYVIYGSFASGLMLYGLSWLYGFTGTLDPGSPDFATGLEAAGVWPVTIILIIVLAGFAFKIGAVPFHFWLPDVYEGAPHPVVSFFSVAPKVAGLAMLLRFLGYVLLSAPGGLRQNIYLIIGLIALGSMVLGNLAALRQTNFRRMLAYSSIAHAGYLLSAVFCLQSDGYAVIMFYLSVYLFMNMGAFFVAGWLEEQLGATNVSDMKGLATGLPLLAVVTTIFMVALTGIPSTAGFVAKLRLFLSVFGEYQATADTIVLVVLIGILVNTVISLFYYLKVPAAMIFSNPVIKSYPAFHGLVPVLLCAMAVPVVWLGIISFDQLINFLQSLAPILRG